MTTALYSCECAVIGAGAVGLAVSRSLAIAGREVMVLEAKGRAGSGISSRSSEVIHAGMYYAPGSLKAHLCVRGCALLYEFLRARALPYERCGKLIVAADERERVALERLMATGLANGVVGLRWLSGTEARRMEPELRCVAAVLSPDTGIFDSHAFLLALEADAVNHGAVVALHSPVGRGWVETDRIVLDVAGSAPARLACRFVVNAAGLGATAVAASIAGASAASIPPFRLAKGSYFAVSGRPPFSRLIYPIPEQAGLGIHFTRDLAGRGRFGPNVEWVDAIDYDVDASQAEQFRRAIERYWPSVSARALQPDYAGIRPKLHGPGEPAADFVLQGPAVHGVPGLVNLFGIESPGLTASLAIAERVLALLTR